MTTAAAPAPRPFVCLPGSGHRRVGSDRSAGRPRRGSVHFEGEAPAVGADQLDLDRSRVFCRHHGRSVEHALRHRPGHRNPETATIVRVVELELQAPALAAGGQDPIVAAKDSAGTTPSPIELTEQVTELPVEVRAALDIGTDDPFENRSGQGFGHGDDQSLAVLGVGNGDRFRPALRARAGRRDRCHRHHNDHDHDHTKLVHHVLRP